MVEVVVFQCFKFTNTLPSFASAQVVEATPLTVTLNVD